MPTKLVYKFCWKAHIKKCVIQISEKANYSFYDIPMHWHLSNFLLKHYVVISVYLITKYIPLQIWKNAANHHISLTINFWAIISPTVICILIIWPWKSVLSCKTSLKKNKYIQKTIGVRYFEPSMAYRKSIHQIGLNKRRSNGWLCISSISFWSFIYIVCNIKETCFSFFEYSVTYSSAFLQKWEVCEIILEKLLENRFESCYDMKTKLQLASRGW